jgi:hypothetical protein
MVLLLRARANHVRVVSLAFALFLLPLFAPPSRAAVNSFDGFAPDVPAAVPTLVQHVATGMDRYPINALTIQLPNPVRAGNCLIFGVQFNSAGSVASVTDDKGNTWRAGPTATNGSFSKRMNLYYVLNAIAGTQTIRVNFSGLSSTPGFPHAVVSEFYNVATANAFDGSVANSTSRTAGTITTTAPGDLIYEWGASLSSSNVNGGAFNGTSITAGAGFTLLSADLQVGSGDQYQIQPSAGLITPTFSASGSAVWGSLAIALKSATAGTAPPPGIRIIHLQHTLLQAVRAQNRSEPIVMQFPSSGNLLVGLYNAAGPIATNVTDSLNNVWSLPASAITHGQEGNTSAQIVYAANAHTAPTLSGIRVSISAVGTGDMMFNLYDIIGAASSPFDLATNQQGTNNTFGPHTTGTITPRTRNGLVLHVNSIDFHQEHRMTSPVGGAFDTVTNDLESPDVSTLDMDNAYAHIYNSTTNQVNFTFTSCCAQAGVGPWGGATAAFKGNSNPTSGSASRAAVIDFNSDARPDYVLQHLGTRQTAIWYLNNNVYIGGAYGPTLVSGWALAGFADFNRDSHSDYALFAPNTKQTALWYLSGPTLIGGAYGPTLPSAWELIGAADFSGDGKPDYVLYNAGTHQTAIWYLNNNVYIGGGYGPTLPPGWNLIGIADFNGDAHPDYALVYESTGQTAIAYLSGTTLTGAAWGPTVPNSWRLVATADFNGNAYPDFLLYGAGTRQTAIWYLNNNAFVGSAFGPTLPVGWTLVAP